MKWKFFVVPLVILIAMSLSANVYSFQKMNDNSSENNKLIGQKEKEINDLKLTVSSLEEDKKDETSNKNNPINTASKESPEVKASGDSINSNSLDYKKEMENSALRFIEYAFTSSSENYALRKKNASNYMTDKLVKTLFSSDGIDESVQRYKTEVEDIKVFVEQGNKDECIVFYNLTMQMRASEHEEVEKDYEEQNSNYVRLSFENANGEMKVSDIQVINVARGA
ncbi:MAG: hypothetical protein ACI35O_16465 [Bacillaceae bacterium]